MKDKTKSLSHFCEKNKLQKHEVAFFFDDILDLSLAKQVGVRMLMKRNNGIAFNQYVAEKNYADYATAGDGGQYGIREASELWMALNPVIAKKLPVLYWRETARECPALIPIPPSRWVCRSPLGMRLPCVNIRQKSNHSRHISALR